MKKGLFACLILLFSIADTTAQRNGLWWFDTGLKAQYGVTSMLNMAIVDSDGYDYDISTGYSFGGKIGINNGNNGISIDVMWAKAKQSFEAPSESNIDVDWSALDLYLLYRNNANLGYFELGPKMSMINKVEVTDVASGVTSSDLSDDYQSAYSAVIGFGAYFLGNDGRFSGILGMRFEYGFSDMINKTSKDKNPPLGDPDIYADGYEKSIPIFAGLVFELNWGIGYVGKATCGARSKFVMF